MKRSKKVVDVRLDADLQVRRLAPAPSPVGDGLAGRQRAAQLHVDGRAPRADQRRVDGRGDGQRVVDVGAVEAVVACCGTPCRSAARPRRSASRAVRAASRAHQPRRGGAARTLPVRSRPGRARAADACSRRPRPARTRASTTCIASGSTATFHSLVGAVFPGERYEPAIITIPRSRLRQLRLAQDRHGHVGERRERDEQQLPGAPARLLDDQVGRVPLSRRPRRRGSSAYPMPRGPCVSGVVDQRPDERHLAPDRHLDVTAARQLQQRPRVLGDLPRLHVAARRR